MKTPWLHILPANMLFQKLMFYFEHAADLSLLSFSMTFFKGDCGDLWHHYSPVSSFLMFLSSVSSQIVSSPPDSSEKLILPCLPLHRHSLCDKYHTVFDNQGRKICWLWERGVANKPEKIATDTETTFKESWEQSYWISFTHLQPIHCHVKYVCVSLSK